jgi:hypothetical protein
VQLDPPAAGRLQRHWRRSVLVWSVLAALALALILVVAGQASGPRSPSVPHPAPPLQFNVPGGHARPE